MKTIKLTLTSLAVIAAFGATFFLSQCKKDTIIVVVQVHDTIKGKSITGLCTYPNYSGVQVAAKGAVISLYLGASKVGTPVATAYADASGNYSLPYLLPNNYFVWASYNNENQNNVKAIEGINFETNPGYAVVMASTNLTQNLVIDNVAPTGAYIVGAYAADTIGVVGSRMAAVESHSKTSFEVRHLDNNVEPYLTIVGGFNVFKITSFLFDEANPANTKFRGYILLSTLNTFEPGRDALGACGPNALQVDTFKTSPTATVTVLPQSDTAYLFATAGQVEKYGKGYLAHATLQTGMKHQGGEIIAPRVTPLKPDTALGYTGPWGVRSSKTVDMYFEYQGKKKVWNATFTTFNWQFEFEGEFTFNRKDVYIKHGLGNEVKVFTHVQLKGTNNKEY